MENKLIVITGPTACGKTTFAAHLAAAIDGEIISADSRQVYRRMDIGTGKDLKDYDVTISTNGNEQKTIHIPYHLIDIAEPGTIYNVYQYQHDFHVAYNDIIKRGHTPILCGGTGLYIESILKAYTFDGRDCPPIDNIVFALSIDRDLRRERISKRLKARLEEGMIEEVKALIDSGVSTERLIRYGLEYKYITLYLLGELSYEEMYNKLEIAIHQFAKRQMTWFRGMEERRNIPINWIDSQLPTDEKIKIVKKIINND